MYKCIFNVCKIIVLADITPANRSSGIRQLSSVESGYKNNYFAD